MVLLAAGDVIVGKYRLDRELARGGMGSVWVARHLQLDTDVAVKLMVPEYASSPEARERFEREARASARLRSPYVVQMYDFGATESGGLFLVMELLQGEDLHARLRRIGRLTPAGAASLVDHVCKALECAHEAGLVHRDLKPANLFLAQHGREETAKVLDFGIAKVMAPALASAATKTGALIGSPHYMSPEQVRRSKDVDPRSDLWSLGVILFQCLTGRVPFAGEELGDVLVAICSDDIPRASQLSPDLGPEVDRFLARALARNRDQRFQSARELAEAFAYAVQAPSANVSSLRGPGVPFPVGPAPAATPFPEATAPSVSTGAAMAPAAPAGSSSDRTFAPSGSTLAPEPGRGRLTGAIAALSMVAVLLGIAAFFVLRSRSTAVGSPTAAGTTSASVPYAAPPPPPAVAQAAPSTEGQQAASAARLPASSAAPTTGGRPSSLAKPAQPAPQTPARPIAPALSKEPHDPLDHR